MEDVDPKAPSYSGFTVAPALPVGILIDGKTGVLSGTPAESMQSMEFTIMGLKSSGEVGQATIVIVIKDFAYPSHLTLFKGVKMEDVDPKAPSYSHFTITPALPLGIVIDGKTGVLSGTPKESMQSMEFTIMGLTSSGEIGRAVMIIVIKDSVSPSDSTIIENGDFAYPSHITLYMGVKMEDVDPKAPSYSHFTVTPALPTGIVIDSKTGVLSGTPVESKLPIKYTITGMKSSGEIGHATIVILIKDSASPSDSTTIENGDFAYPSHLTLFKDVKMEDVDPKAPSYSHFTITPALPLGIVIDGKTGVLSGTPKESMQSMEFTIMGLTSSGEIGRAVMIIVIKDSVSPSDSTIIENGDFAYPSHITLYMGVKMEDVDPKAPSYSHFTVTPALPTGIVIDSKTGVLSGTPVESKLPIKYTITGMKSSGEIGHATIVILIKDSASPSDSTTIENGDFAYPSHLTLFKDVKMEDVDPKAPSYSHFTITPALPLGIVIDGKTGVLSGTPAESMQSMEFTIMGLKSSGEIGQATIVILIKDSYCEADGLFPQTPVGQSVEVKCGLYGRYVGTLKRSCVINKSVVEWSPLSGFCVPVFVLVIGGVVVIISIVAAIIAFVRTIREEQEGKTAAPLIDVKV